MNVIAAAISRLGGDSAVSRLLRKADGDPLTPKAVRKWRLAGKLPRTEATGETNYAEQMAALDPRLDEDKLRATAFVGNRQ